MAYIEVDVNLDEFDTSDLVSEVLDRLKRDGRKRLSEQEKKDVKEVFADFAKELGLPQNEVIVTTLDANIKLEYLMQAFHKYSLAELEQRIPV
jgi:hypothetical protein